MFCNSPLKLLILMAATNYSEVVPISISCDAAEVVGYGILGTRVITMPSLPNTGDVAITMPKE